MGLLSKVCCMFRAFQASFLSSNFFDLISGVVENTEGRAMVTSGNNAMYGGLENVVIDSSLGAYDIVMTVATYASGIAFLSAFITFQLYAHDILSNPQKSGVIKTRMISICVVSFCIFAITSIIDIVIKAAGVFVFG